MFCQTGTNVQLWEIFAWVYHIIILCMIESCLIIRLEFRHHVTTIKMPIIIVYFVWNNEMNSNWMLFIGCEELVHITYVGYDGKFTVQLQRNSEVIKKLTRDIHDYCNTVKGPEDLTSINAGMHWIVMEGRAPSCLYSCLIRFNC